MTGDHRVMRVIEVWCFAHNAVQSKAKDMMLGDTKNMQVGNIHIDQAMHVKSCRAVMVVVGGHMMYVQAATRCMCKRPHAAVCQSRKSAVDDKLLDTLEVHDAQGNKYARALLPSLHVKT